MYLYILLGIIGILLVILIGITISKKKQEEKYKEKYIEEQQQKWQSAFANEAAKLEFAQKRREDFEKNFDVEMGKYNKILNDRKQEIENLLRAQNEQIEQKKEDIDKILNEYFEKKQAEYERTLRAVQTEMQDDAALEMYQLEGQYNTKIEGLIKSVNEYQAKQAAINEQILRQRAIDEEQDFYRICITEDDLEDIDVLLALKARLHRTSFLDKITYDTYVSKYVKEMAKRVLAGEDPSGIYKVTNIKTNEIYIGKSTTVATRWQNHTKSAFGLEGVADSQFQRALKKYGVQNFTWELLEEVPKDKLGEREKFYISFYDTTNYGYNQRVG